MNYINIQHAVSVEQLLVLRLVGNYWFQFHYSVDNVFKQLIGFSNETYKQICQFPTTSTKAFNQHSYY